MPQASFVQLNKINEANNSEGFSITEDFILTFIKSLNDYKLEYCVLRNYQDIGKNLEEDVDILARPTDLIKIKKILCTVAKENNCYVYFKKLHGRNLTMKVCYRDFDFSEETKPVIIKIHIVGYVPFYLTKRQRTTKGLAKRVFLCHLKTINYKIGDIDVKIPHPNWEFLILLSRLEFKAKKKYQQRCLSLIRTHKLSGDLGIGLDELENIVNAAYVGQIHGCYRSIIRRFLRAIKPRLRPSVIFQGCFLIILNIINLTKKKGLIISLSGPDGSGKTTVWKLVQSSLSDKLGCNVICTKYLYPVNNNPPMFVRNFHAKVRKVDNRSSQVVERDRGSGFRWTFRRMLGLISIILQYPIGYMVAIFNAMKGYITIVETSYIDAFVKGHRPHFRIIQHLTLPMLPSGDLYFLLKAKPANIVKRKPELTTCEIEDYYQRIYRLIAISKITPCVIASDQGIEVTINMIIHKILSRLDSI